MPMPTEERVSQLVAELVERRGFDLEGVAISAAGPASKVKVTVDSDGSPDLDAVAELSTEISQTLDDAGDFGETPYLLEITTPGIDRPLTTLRHWQRAQGRKVKITLNPGAESPEGKSTFEARVGVVTGTDLALVLGGKRKPHRVTVPLADIRSGVVQVEFSPPGAAELELAGGVAPGRPQPGAQETSDIETTESDSPTEGIVE